MQRTKDNLEHAGWALFTHIDVGDRKRQPFFIFDHEDIGEVEVIKAEINQKSVLLSASVGRVFIDTGGDEEKLVVMPRDGSESFEYSDMIPIDHLHAFLKAEEMRKELGGACNEKI
ncbi:MAG: hypothetical protein IBX56_20065 [Methylomicrobium sp.]|nr:hypothetical protein [Methylomicrobium sp.]